MAVPAEQFYAEMFMEERIARLEEKVDHIQSDIKEMKGDIKDVRGDIRRVDGKIDAVRDSVAALECKMLERFAALDSETLKGFADLREGQWKNKVWFLLTAAGILGIMAHGFKWI